MRLRFAAICLAVLLLTGATSKEDLRSSLITVEGTVLTVASAPGEGDLEVLTVTLAPKGAEGRELDLLLAPKATLDEVDFQVEQGDEIQARVFPADEGTAKVHKVRNMSRHTTLRLPAPFTGFHSGMASVPGRVARGREPWGDKDSTDREATAQDAESRHGGRQRHLSASRT